MARNTSVAPSHHQIEAGKNSDEVRALAVAVAELLKIAWHLAAPVCWPRSVPPPVGGGWTPGYTGEWRVDWLTLSDAFLFLSSRSQWRAGQSCLVVPLPQHFILPASQPASQQARERENVHIFPRQVQTEHLLRMFRFDLVCNLSQLGEKLAKRPTRYYWRANCGLYCLNWQQAEIPR